MKIQIEVEVTDCKELTELLNYGEAALHYTGLVRNIKDQIINGLADVATPNKLRAGTGLVEAVSGMKRIPAVEFAKPGKSTMSAEGRANIAAAQRKRWREAKRKK